MNTIVRWWMVMTLFLGLASAQKAGSFVGKLEGSEAFIAVVLGADQKVLAYVCDSNQVALWFVGKLEADQSFKLASGQSRVLQGRLEGEKLTGLFSLEGKTQSFSALPSSNKAGLYRFVGDVGGERYIGGWIQNAQGEQRGSVIGGGSLRASLLNIDSLLSDYPALASSLAWLVTPEWVSQNISL